MNIPSCRIHARLSAVVYQYEMNYDDCDPVATRCVGTVLGIQQTTHHQPAVDSRVTRRR
jgi:hypothetical protein